MLCESPGRRVSRTQDEFETPFQLFDFVSQPILKLGAVQQSSELQMHGMMAWPFVRIVAGSVNRYDFEPFIAFEEGSAVSGVFDVDRYSHSRSGQFKEVCSRVYADERFVRSTLVTFPRIDPMKSGVQCIEDGFSFQFISRCGEHRYNFRLAAFLRASGLHFTNESTRASDRIQN
jgi:hypothetical protein